MVAEGIAELVPYARERGVRLGIEPLHPMFAADRSVIVTLGQANTLAERFPAEQVGVVVDVYHVWWDPDLYGQIERAAERILGFHVNDWIVPTPDLLLGRGMMGDGVIEIRRVRTAVDVAGYAGPIEVEIFNQAIWDTPGDAVLAQMAERYLAHV
jgi:sugar phosphate isomerase/epimerase